MPKRCTTSFTRAGPREDAYRSRQLKRATAKCTPRFTASHDAEIPMSRRKIAPQTRDAHAYRRRRHVTRRYAAVVSARCRCDDTVHEYGSDALVIAKNAMRVVRAAVAVVATPRKICEAPATAVVHPQRTKMHRDED